MLASSLHNPHLEGGAFSWEAGPIGVFLSHGLTATATEMRTLARRLYDNGYSVAGPLLPGHGTTIEELNRTRWQDWARSGEDTYAQLAARCRRVFIGGESMGALLALYLASIHPEAAGVLAYAPVVKLALKTTDTIRLHLFAAFLPSVPKATMANRENWQGYAANPLKAALQLLRMQKEVRARLPLIRQPVLVIQGRLDRTIDPSSGQIILDGVASELKELYWMEKSEHIVALDQELDQVAALTLDFMRRALG